MVQFTWTGAFSTDVGDQRNWSPTDGQPPGVPGSGDLAFINTSATLAGNLNVDVATFAGAIALQGVIQSNTANISNGSGSVYVPVHGELSAGLITVSGRLTVEGSIGSGRLVVAGGGGGQGNPGRLILSGTAGVGTAEIGGNFGSGVVEVSGASGFLHVGNGVVSDLDIGSQALGALEITTGGIVLVDGVATIAIGVSPTNGVGEVRVNGATLQAINRNIVVGGSEGRGLVEITNGGLFTAFSLTMGTGLNPVSDVLVSGTNSRLNLGSFLVVGQDSPNSLIDSLDTTLTIENGGHVGATTATVGKETNSYGRVLITGLSDLTFSGTLIIGDHGTGYIRVENGGQLATFQTPEVHIGHWSGSSGALELSNATFNMSSSSLGLHVGHGGRGSLLVEQGALLKPGAAISVGTLVGSEGAIKVTGTGSAIEFVNQFTIGDAGQGSLIVEDGAKVSASKMVIAKAASSISSVTVLNATIDAFGGDVVVGDSGVGTLDLDFDSAMSVQNLTIGNNPPNPNDWAQASSVNVKSGFSYGNRNPDHGLIVGGTIYVGKKGQGLLTIAHDGYVQVTDIVIGDEAGSHGKVSVQSTYDVDVPPASSARSELNVSNSLTVGNLGVGELVVKHAGESFVRAARIDIAAAFRTDPNVQFDGMVTISNGTVEAAAITVGAGGRGNLTIDNGTLKTNSLVIGSAGGTGEVHIDDHGAFSKLTNLGGGPGNVQIGVGGKGLLTMDGFTLSAAVTVGQLGMLRGSGEIGPVNSVQSFGEIHAEDGALKIVGPVTGGGTIFIHQGASLELGTTSSNAVNFMGGRGTKLILDHPGTMPRPQIDGLQGGNEILLKNILPAAGNWDPDPATHTVNVNGIVFSITADLDDLANFHFVGNSNFQGTTLVWVPKSSWSQGNDNLNFNNLTGAQLAAVAGGAALRFSYGGNDIVVLPDVVNMASIGWDPNELYDAGDGDDSVTGGTGNDIMSGGNGIDTLSGGPGADQFVWSAPATGTDTILDFSAEEGDKLVFDRAGFGLIGTGALSAAGVDFVQGTVSRTTVPTVLAAGSDVFFDADGTGPAAAVLLAHVGTATQNLVATGDFNGDGTLDLLWKNVSTGASTSWLLSTSGGELAQNALPSTAGYDLAATGDFNNNGVTDLVWRNPSNGSTVTWLLANGGVGAQAALPSTLGYSLIAHGDFDGDGITDLMWKNDANGQTIAWLMSNTGAIASDAALSSTAGYGMLVAGDFNGDGHTDTIWKNVATGETIVWRMFAEPGLNKFDAALSSTAGYNLVASGDFNADGHADTIWKETSTGNNVAWLMFPDQNSNKSDAALSSTQGYSKVAEGDLNGDGTIDVLWRHDSTGETIAWLINAVPGQNKSDVALSNTLGYSAVASGDFDGNGTTDIMWRHNASGDMIEWLMSTAGNVGFQSSLPNTAGRSVLASGDFNGDGTTDVIWERSSDGATEEWLTASDGSVAIHALASTGGTGVVHLTKDDFLVA